MSLFKFLIAIIGVVFCIGALLYYSYTFVLPESHPAPDTLTTTDGRAYFRYDDQGKLTPFNLLDPEEAPQNIHEAVMLGYHIMENTSLYAEEFTRSKLNCSSCHFSGGNTLGGENGGISLVGVVSEYPKYSQRDKKKISLQQRIQECFLRSMNGKAPPIDSPVIKALTAYLNWISKDLLKVKKVPWLGLNFIKTKVHTDLEQGKKIYENMCASCHQEEGNGSAPPLWGPTSYNTGAGMYKLATLASFIYWNMPEENPILNDQEALDVASYLLSKPRPSFEN